MSDPTPRRRRRRGRAVLAMVASSALLVSGVVEARGRNDGADRTSPFGPAVGGKPAERLGPPSHAGPGNGRGPDRPGSGDGAAPGDGIGTPGRPPSATNTSPVALDASGRAFSDAGEVLVTLVGTDADGDVLTFTLLDGDLVAVPDGDVECEVATGGSSRCEQRVQVDVPTVPGDYELRFRVSDGAVTAPRPGRLTLTVEPAMIAEPLSATLPPGNPQDFQRARRVIELVGTSASSNAPFVFLIPFTGLPVPDTTACDNNRVEGYRVCTPPSENCETDEGSWTCTFRIEYVTPNSSPPGVIEQSFEIGRIDVVDGERVITQRSGPAALALDFPYRLAANSDAGGPNSGDGPRFSAPVIDGPRGATSEDQWTIMWARTFGLNTSSQAGDFPRAAVLQDETSTIVPLDAIDPDRADRIAVRVVDQSIRRLDDVEGVSTAVDTDAACVDTDTIAIEAVAPLDGSGPVAGHVTVDALEMNAPVGDDVPWACWVGLEFGFDEGGGEWSAVNRYTMLVLPTHDRYRPVDEVILPAIRFDATISGPQPEVRATVVRGLVPDDDLRLWWPMSLAPIDVRLDGGDLVIRPTAAVTAPVIVPIRVFVPGLRSDPAQQVVVNVSVQPPLPSGAVIITYRSPTDVQLVLPEAVLPPTSTAVIETGQSISLTGTMSITALVPATSLFGTGTSTTGVIISTSGQLSVSTSGGSTTTTLATNLTGTSTTLTVQGCVDLTTGDETGCEFESAQSGTQITGAAEQFLATTVVRSDYRTSTMTKVYNVSTGTFWS